MAGRFLCLLPTALAVLVLAGCDSWYGANKKPLPGERISILLHEKKLEPDADARAQEIRLPRPETNADWPQAGGYSTHVTHHAQLGADIRRVWSASVGSSATKERRLLAEPIVGGGRLYAFDREQKITAIDAKTGGKLWSVPSRDKDDDSDAMGGGLAYDDDRLYASTPFGDIVAFDAAKGGLLWRTRLSAPLRSAPTVRGGRIFVISSDNQTFALKAEDGSKLWTHSGISEMAVLLGGASPAADNSVVVVPYSSGELYALRPETGAVLWADSLAGVRRTDQVTLLSDIRGRPAIDRGRVYAVGHGEVAVAIDMRTGRRLWDAELGGLQSPWIAGDYIFQITIDSELVALEARTGRILWVLPLQRWKDEEDKTGPIIWSGPILASDRLIVASTHGFALSVSPYTGEVLGQEKLSDPVSVPPVVAGDTLYFLTDNADILAYR